MESVSFARRFDNVTGSAIREIFKVLGRPGMISFAGGNPSAATTLRVIGRLSALPTESGGMVKAPVRSAAIVTFQI